MQGHGLKDFDQFMRTLDDKINLVSSQGVMNNHPSKTMLNSKMLITKMQLLQLEIMMHQLRDVKSEKADTCSNLMSKSFDRVDVQYLQEKGFARFIAIFYRLKGYYMQWVADQTVK